MRDPHPLLGRRASRDTSSYLGDAARPRAKHHEVMADTFVRGRVGTGLSHLPGDQHLSVIGGVRNVLPVCQDSQRDDVRSEPWPR